MRIREVYCYDLLMAQKLCRMGYKITYAKKIHDGNIVFCFEDVGQVAWELDKLIDAKRKEKED